MKTFRFILLWSLVAFAMAFLADRLSAQTPANRTALNAFVDSRLPSGTGSITAANLRLMFKDVIASDFNTINADAQPISANLTFWSALAPSSKQDALGFTPFANPMTTAGDIIIGGASGVPTRQAQGGNGTFWGVSGGVAGYYTPSGGGNVSNSGTPTSGQIATWTSSTVIQGVGASTLSDLILGGLASNGFVKRAGANAYSVDTSTYLTANQSISFTPTGDVTSSGGAGATNLTPALTVTKLNGTSLAGLATGILKNTTATGVPSIAIAADFPTLNQNTSGTASNVSGTPALPNGTTATTQSIADNTTKIATTAFVIANAGGGSVANPTGTIGLTAVNGVATSAIRSDGAPALSVAIVPHWTAQHWFDLNPRITDNAAPTTATSALALGTNYTLNGLTANYSFTSLSGTSGKSRIHLVGCDGTHTFTWTTAAQRNGDPVGTSTVMTPSAGDHNYIFWYDTVTSAYYYADDNIGINAVASGGTGLSSGTSGGILAFTASGTLASSGVLAANALMVGGGAGVAPSTVTTGTGILTALGINTGSAGAPVLFNGAGGSPSSITLPSAAVATTQTALDNSTKIATTAYADAAVKATAASSNLGNCTGTINIDWSAVPNGGMFRGVLTGNTTFTFSNGSDGKTIIVDVGQTGTNTFTVTWPSMKWPGGVAPTMTTGAATSDITTIVDVNGTFKGSSVQNVK